MDFNEHAATYAQEVESAIEFSGRDHDFFLAAKIRPLLALVRERCGDPSELVGLDLGCGTGRLTHLLETQVRRLYGVDVATASLREAHGAAPAAAFARYDGLRLPFATGAFDFAYTVCVLHHVPVGQRSALLAEVSRVVRPGGVVVVFEHNPWNPLTRWVVARCSFDKDAVLLRCTESRRRLHRAGLERIEHGYILLTPWQSPLWQKAEAAARGLPLGAQYWVAASKPAEGAGPT